MTALCREEILPEERLPDAAEAIARGRAQEAQALPAQESEADLKRRAMAEGRLMLHAQIGYRDPARSREAWRRISEATEKAGQRVDRFGICLDWSMGYPAAERAKRPKGTGLILEDPEDWTRLVAAGGARPHFGDFVLGLPAAVENARAALAAGATAIGNRGQYFTFRLPGWSDDVGTTAATVEAIAFLAAQRQEILIHSNLDDGFAALFGDLATAFGAVLLERTIVEDLLSGRVGHCYGHSFSDPLTRLAFQRALAREPGAPGTMIYGNTVAYRGSGPENYAALARYLTVDALGQLAAHTGHALNPVPVTEAERIPDIEEVIAAQLFALRLLERIEDMRPLVSFEQADVLAVKIVDGGRAFHDRVLAGLADAGVDCRDPIELLLALRRIGGKRLEELYGPGATDPEAPHGRRPLVMASTLAELERRAETIVQDTRRLNLEGLTLCIGSSDVHEYGKMLAEAVCRRLGVTLLDAGIHAEPEDLAELALAQGADAVVIATYNGVALSYFEALRDALTIRHSSLPIVIGGRLNQIPEASNSSLPRDVTVDLKEAGALPCTDMADLPGLLETLRKEAVA